MRCPRTIAALGIGSALIVQSVILIGCEDKRRHRTSDSVKVEAVEAPLQAGAEPVEVVRALVGALADAQATRLGGFRTADDRRAYDRAMGALRALAAGDSIYESFQSRKTSSASIPPDADKDAVLTVLTESWVSIVAHYAEGFRLETLRQVSRTDEGPGGRAAVTLLALRPTGDRVAVDDGDDSSRALVKVQLVRRRDRSWGIMRVDLGPAPREGAGLPLLPVSRETATQATGPPLPPATP